MSITIHEIGSGQFPLYAKVPVWFEVRSLLRVEAVEAGLGGFRLVEEIVDKPFTRHCDEHHEDNPAGWATRFDVSKSGYIGVPEVARYAMFLWHLELSPSSGLQNPARDPVTG